MTKKTASGQVAAVPDAIYMLDSTRDMKPLVGELVDIKGVVVSKDSKRGTIRIAVGADAEKTTDVEVTTGAGKSMTTADFEGKQGGQKRDSVVEVSRPVYRVNVDSISAVNADRNGPACK